MKHNVGGTTIKMEAISDVDIRTYAKYLLQEGSVIEKREILGNLKSKLVYRDGKITPINLVPEPS